MDVCRPSRRGERDTTVKNLAYSFLKDETSATAVEYGLIAAGIAVVIVAVLRGLGTKLNTVFASVSAALE